MGLDWPHISLQRVWWPILFTVFFNTVLRREHSRKVLNKLFSNFCFGGITQKGLEVKHGARYMYKENKILFKLLLLYTCGTLILTSPKSSSLAVLLVHKWPLKSPPPPLVICLSSCKLQNTSVCKPLTLLAEAVDAIVTYSHTASQLLRRKKVKREHIYQYLAENGMIEPVTSDKPSLIRKAMLYWGSPQEVGCSFL